MIVSALTGICSFVIPNVSIVSGLRISKYVVIFFAAVFRAVRGLGGTAAASGTSGKSHLLWHPLSVSLLLLLRQ